MIMVIILCLELKGSFCCWGLIWCLLWVFRLVFLVIIFRQVLVGLFKMVQWGWWLLGGMSWVLLVNKLLCRSLYKLVLVFLLIWWGLLMILFLVLQFLLVIWQCLVIVYRFDIVIWFWVKVLVLFEQIIEVVFKVLMLVSFLIRVFCCVICLIVLVKERVMVGDSFLGIKVMIILRVKIKDLISGQWMKRVVIKKKIRLIEIVSMESCLVRVLSFFCRGLMFFLICWVSLVILLKLVVILILIIIFIRLFLISEVLEKMMLLNLKWFLLVGLMVWVFLLIGLILLVKVDWLIWIWVVVRIWMLVVMLLFFLSLMMLLMIRLLVSIFWLWLLCMIFEQEGSILDRVLVFLLVWYFC